MFNQNLHWILQQKVNLFLYILKSFFGFYVYYILKKLISSKEYIFEVISDFLIAVQAGE